MSLEVLLSNAKFLAEINVSQHFSDEQKKHMLSIAFSIHKEGELDGNLLDAMFTKVNVEDNVERKKYSWYFDQISEPIQSPTSIEGTRINNRNFDNPPLTELKRMAERFVAISGETS